MIIIFIYDLEVVNAAVFDEISVNFLKRVVWKGIRVYEVKRTAHWCIEACDYSYLIVLTGDSPHLKEQMMISYLISDIRRREAT